jgi:hypothetical protein
MNVRMNRYLKVCLVLFLVLTAVVAVGMWKGPDSFVFAWILNFALMLGVFYFTHHHQLQLTSTYYSVKKWEDQGKIYKWFGVNVFRKILVWVGWEKIIKAVSPVNKSPEALKQLEYGTRQSEFGHLLIFFIVLLVNVFVAIYYGATKSLSLFALNIILNFYPIILQRYNRPRLLRAIHIREANYVLPTKLF